MLNKIKKKIKNKITNIKSTIGEVRKKRKNITQKPGAKRKNAALGFGTVLAVFGISLALPFLTAAAKNIPAPAPGTAGEPGALAPAPQPPTPPTVSILGDRFLEGGMFAICLTAMEAGSFILGGFCGAVVVIGILKNRKK